MLTSRNRGTFKGEIFATENQNTARMSGEAALVLQDIMFFKTDGIVKVFMSFSNFNFYDLILKFI